VWREEVRWGEEGRGEGRWERELSSPNVRDPLTPLLEGHVL